MCTAITPVLDMCMCPTNGNKIDQLINARQAHIYCANFISIICAANKYITPTGALTRTYAPEMCCSVICVQQMQIKSNHAHKFAWILFA